jgi:hypothetical protein
VSLGPSLALVFFAFVALLCGVIVVAFRERKLARLASPTRAAQQASDARVMATIFLAIPGGMLLTLAVAYLVFAP